MDQVDQVDLFAAWGFGDRLRCGFCDVGCRCPRSDTWSAHIAMPQALESLGPSISWGAEGPAQSSKLYNYRRWGEGDEDIGKEVTNSWPWKHLIYSHCAPHFLFSCRDRWFSCRLSEQGLRSARISELWALTGLAAQTAQEDFQHPFSIWQSAEHTGDKLSRNLGQ